MSNIKREIGILRKEQKEMLEVKSNITAMENIRKSWAINCGYIVSELSWIVGYTADVGELLGGVWKKKKGYWCFHLRKLGEKLWLKSKLIKKLIIKIRTEFIAFEIRKTGQKINTVKS